MEPFRDFVKSKLLLEGEDIQSPRELKVGKVYTLKKDIVYERGVTADELRDMAYGEKYIARALRPNGDVVFKKGTKIKCTRSGDLPSFMIYGDEIELRCDLSSGPLEFVEGTYQDRMR